MMLAYYTDLSFPIQAQNVEVARASRYILEHCSTYRLGDGKFFVFAYRLQLTSQF